MNQYLLDPEFIFINPQRTLYFWSSHVSLFQPRL